MAAINEINLAGVAAKHGLTSSGAGVEDQIKEAAALGLWVWISQHRDTRKTIKVISWFPPISIRLWDIRGLLELLLGPCPPGVCDK